MKKIFVVGFLTFCAGGLRAQVLSLDAVIDSIRAAHPVVKMYDNEIRSMDEAAKGARSWMPPQFGFGQFMTPYNVNRWRKNGEMTGMGSVMLSGEQMFPNKKKLNADEAYMRAMSSVEKARKNASLNELAGTARQWYYEWIVLKKKAVVVRQNQQLLDFMIKNAEIRYRNGLEKISAYYKAKAALGSLENMQLMLENEMMQRRIRLNVLMGRGAMEVFDIDTLYRVNDYAALVFDSTLFYSHRSDLKAIDREIALAGLKQETERQSLKPQFGIRYDHMIGFGGQPMQYTLMGMVKLPVAGSAKMNRTNIESLKWKAAALESQKKMMANEYSGMAYGMRTEIALKKEQLTRYEREIIPALRNNYRTMQLAYEQNTEELFMLYDAWEKLNMTQLEYLGLLNDVLVMQASLERLIEKP